MRLKKWTKEEEQLLKENAYMPMRELVYLLPDRNRKTIYWKLSVLGINRQTYKRYSKEEDNYIFDNYKTKGNRAIAKVLKRTEKSIAKRMIVLGISRTSEDLKNLAKTNKGCYKKGEVSNLAYLDGTLHLHYDIKRDEYYYKIKHNGEMVRYSRYLYEVFHNVKLTSKDIIRHKDGNALNIKIDNLELVDRFSNLDININNDKAFVKRIFRIKDEKIVQELIENGKPLIEIKKNQLKLNKQIQESCKNS